MSIFLNEDHGRKALDIRWIESANSFFVDFGNVRFAVSPTAAKVLAEGLLDALKDLPKEYL